MEPSSNSIPIVSAIVPKRPPKDFFCPRVHDTNLANGIDKVSQVAVSSNLVAVASEDGKVFLNVIEEENVKTSDDHNTNRSESQRPSYYQGQECTVEALIFLQEGRKLVSVWEKGGVIVFNTNNGRIFQQCNAPSGLHDCVYSEKHNVLYLGGEHGIATIALTGNSSDIGIEDFVHTSRLFSKDKYFINKDSEQIEGIEDIEDSESLSNHSRDEISIQNENELDEIAEDDKELEQQCVYSLDLSTNNTELIDVCEYGCHMYGIKGRDVRNVFTISDFSKNAKVKTAVMSPNGMVLAVGYDSKVSLINSTCKSTFHKFKFQGECESIVFSDDGKLVYFSTGNGKTVFVHDVMSGIKLNEFHCPDEVRRIALCDKDTLLVACMKSGIKSIDVSMRSNHQLVKRDEVQSIVISPNSNLIALFCVIGTNETKSLLVLNSFTQEEIWSELHGDAYSINFSPDGKKIACCTERDVIIYDSMTGEKLSIINHCSGLINGKTSKKTSIFCSIKFLRNNLFLFVNAREDDGREFSDITVFQMTSGDCLTSLKIPENDTFKELVVIPEMETIAVLSSEDKIYFFYNDRLKQNEDMTFKSTSKKCAQIDLIAFSFRGDQALICFRTALKIYRFDRTKGIDESLLLASVEMVNDVYFKSECIAITTDDKLVALSNDKFVIISSLGEDAKKLYQIPCFGVKSLQFVPSKDKDKYFLLVFYGDGLFNFEVDTNGTKNERMNSFIQHQYFRCKDKEIIAAIMEFNDLIYVQDNNEEGFICAALKQYRSKIAKKVIGKNPSSVWFDQRFQTSAIKYLLKNSRENMIREVTINNNCVPPHAATGLLEEITKYIPVLAEKGAIDILCHILQAGSSKCVKGFVPGNRLYLIDQPSSYTHQLMIQFNRRLRPDNKERQIPCDGFNLLPQTSEYHCGFELYQDVPRDRKKRLALNIARVLLPSLASLDTLKALLNIESRSDHNIDSYGLVHQGLKPFDCQSLRTSIDANWYCWAQKKLIMQAVYYLFWTFFIFLIDWVDIKHIGFKVVLTVIILLGLTYHVLEEWKQIRVLGIEYSSDFWNQWQTMTYFLVLLFIFFNILDIFKVSTGSSFSMFFIFNTGDVSGKDLTAPQFSGYVQFSVIINLFYYCRASDRVSWILYALKRLIAKIFYFQIILLWIVFASSLLMSNTHTFNKRHDIGAFVETYLIAVSGEFDVDDHHSWNSHDNSWIDLVLFLILSIVFIIFMNAMIAFISEDFSNILDNKPAVLSREKALIMVDLLCAMRPKDREKLENSNKWVYKPYKRTFLDKINEEGHEKDMVKVNAEMAKVKEEIKSMKKDNDELKELLSSMIKSKLNMSL